MTLRRFAGAMMLAAAVFVPGTARAQTVVGHVLDSLTAAPVPTAAVMLLDSTDVAVDVAETDSLGRFVLQAPGTGRYRVYADRMAYQEVFSEDLALGDAGFLELLVRLVPLPVELDPLTVTAEGRLVKLEELGFYRRRDWSPGYFIDRQEIETWKPQYVTDLLRTIPAVTVRYDSSKGGSVLLNRRSYGRCPMKLVLDGSKVDTVAPLDDLVHPDHIIGIEVYPSGVGAPIQHRGTDAFCGIVMVWTR